MAITLTEQLQVKPTEVIEQITQDALFQLVIAYMDEHKCKFYVAKRTVIDVLDEFLLDNIDLIEDIQKQGL